VDPSLLWLTSHFRHPSGYAEEARTVLRALELAGHAPAARKLRPRRPTPSGDPRWNVDIGAEAEALLALQLGRRPRAPCVAVHHYPPRPTRGPLAGKVNVARTMFETDGLPEGWREWLAPFVDVWVPSHHTRDVFAAGGVDEERLRVIGETLDFEAFDPDVEPYPLDAPDGHFVFLSSFDFSERKGWRQLVLAWSRAFAANDAVCLVLKTGSVARYDDEVVLDRIEGFVRGAFGRAWPSRLAPLRILPRMVPSFEVPRLYAAADAYVSASRGEAWGRPYAEAMAMGLPTIGTRFGGNLDFMTDANSWLVGGEVVPVTDTDDVVSPLYRGHRWFEADVDELAAVLREVAGDPAKAARRASSARGELRQRFDPVRIAGEVMGAAREAAARAPALAA
jgi:glycosyltransferase involved in cell wall biosynthesis